MRFADDREVLVKRTEDDDDRYKYVSTPRRVSPMDSTGQIKSAFSKMAGEILWPATNRARRRANGQVRSRRRVRGTLPPHPLGVINAAHRIERDAARKKANAEKRLIAAILAGDAVFDEDRADQ